ncbi:MAG: alpha/beta hydrolase [Archangiaceae bacterium]|nr:alpha/beta hydrolase [Archangiaceae bacterium]
MPEIVFETPTLNRYQRLRRTVGAAITDGLFAALTQSTRYLPIAHPRLHGVEVLRDVPYREHDHRAHRADLWLPKAKSQALRPVVLYIHGGRFAKLSKETHWVFNLLFARRGYLVMSINYRLAPRHRYPAAIEDVCEAWRWLHQNAARYGGDPEQMIVAGESAGGNLATALTVATCYRRPEPFARRVFDETPVPRAVMPACGILQVSNPERFKVKLGYLQDRLHEVAEDYLSGVRFDAERGLDLADPLVALERGEQPDRPLPPFFAPCGTWDVLIDDHRRLAAALGRLGVRCDARYYPRGFHAFHGFIFTPTARRCWRDAFAFLTETVPPRR